LLRQLLLDWDIIGGQGGPGAKRGDGGAWHGFCHLAGGAGLFRTPGGKGVWVGITFDSSDRRYCAGLCCGAGEVVHSLNSREAERLLRTCEWRGFIEGASRGHILDRSADDPGDPELDDRRQDYDQNVDSENDGGPVWEFWTVSRDIVDPTSLGLGLVAEYLALLSFLGGRFAGVVARGRSESDYGRFVQLRAMVVAGLIDARDALWDISPVAIPRDTERLLLSATPAAFAEAATDLVAREPEITYFMYERKLSSFAPVAGCTSFVK